MPEINSIPYESAEDLNKYLYDEFYSTEQIDELTTQTAGVTTNIFEMMLSTGVTANSICETYYNLNYFNPLYGEAVWKLYMNSMQNVKAFFGFKKTTAEPVFPSVGPMVESHAGFMVDSGRLYASVGNGYSQQRVEIYGIDMTHVENYKIAYNRFSIMPLPVIEEELGLPEIYSIDRKWKEMTALSDFPPANEVHWIMQFIKNTTGAAKYLKINRFIYKEVYAD
jgi:hypothetical protein